MASAHAPALLAEAVVYLAAALVIVPLFYRLKLGAVLGYLVAGMLIGPDLLGLVARPEAALAFAEFGVVLLLFVIGLELRPKRLWSLKLDIFGLGAAQVLLCGIAITGFLLLATGLSWQAALVVGLPLALSSTAIVVKLLYDKFELDTLAGRLTVGILVIQDVYAILVLAFQPNLADPQAWPIIKALAASAVLLAAGFLLSSLVLRHVFAAIAKSPELVVATSIGWCAFVAGAAGAMDLSKEMGALVAGLTISAFPYSLHVTAKTLPLRDFFLTLFFLSLGMKIEGWTMPMAGSSRTSQPLASIR